MIIGEICNREVTVIQKSQPIQDAVILMRDNHVGDVVVVDGHDGELTPIGILTDRDIVVEILSEGIDLDAVNIGDIMSYELLTAKEEDGLPETIESMKAKGVRRVPVVNNKGTLVGILAVDDLIDFLAEQLALLSGLIASEQRKEKRLRA